MYVILGKNRETKKYDILDLFWNDWEFYNKFDDVDKTKYSDCIITDESGTHCLFYYEFEDYTPYFKKYKKV